MSDQKPLQTFSNLAFPLTYNSVNNDNLQFKLELHLFKHPDNSNNFYLREIASIGEFLELHVHAPDLTNGLILLDERLLQLDILRHDFLLHAG